MTDAARASFDAFVRENLRTLMNIGIAVSGSRAEAEDIVQTALTSTYARWQKSVPEDALAYVRRSILNANISRWRRFGRVETVTATPPETARVDAPSAAVEDRQLLLPLLRQLPPRQRAVLVLRYLCDLPDDQIAETLRISPGTVRSQAARGLDHLRRLVASPDPPETRDDHHLSPTRPHPTPSSGRSVR